jgi:hypothetical protein
MGVSNDLPGPEQVFRVRISRRVANFGVRVVTQGRDAHVTPRIVLAGNENRLAGVPALPVDVNPYRSSYGDGRLIVAANRPSPGAYDVVFDTRSSKDAGAFSFRLWINDTTPPRAHLLTPVTRSALVLAVADGGSGVDPQSIRARVDGASATVSYAAGRVRVLASSRLARGRHRLVFTVADYQETKNSESVVGILSNTTVLNASFRVR